MRIVLSLTTHSPVLPITLEVLLASDSADDGDGWGGATLGGGGDMGPNSGSVVVLGVTFHGVVALAAIYFYAINP